MAKKIKLTNPIIITPKELEHSSLLERDIKIRALDQKIIDNNTKLQGFKLAGYIVVEEEDKITIVGVSV